MKIIYSNRAKRDLLVIGDYLRQNDFNLETLAQIRDKIKMLKQHPHLGRSYDQKTRQITVMRRNVVYYEITSDAIHILHISAGRQEKKL